MSDSHWSRDSLIDTHRNARRAEGGSPGGAHRHHPASSQAQPAAALLPGVPRHCRHLFAGGEGALCNGTCGEALHTSSQVGALLPIRAATHDHFLPLINLYINKVINGSRLFFSNDYIHSKRYEANKCNLNHVGFGAS